jgi:hypothetical protein
LTIGCSGAFAPAGYSPLSEACPFTRLQSSGTFAPAALKPLWLMPDHAAAIARAPLALAIVNARVSTGDERRPWADAVLIRGAVIIAVGSSAELRKRTGAGGAVIDAGGRLVVPLAADGRIAADEPADLALVDRAAPSHSDGESGKDDFIFALERGRVIVDRDGLLGTSR